MSASIAPTRWQALWQGFGLAAPADEFAALATRYAEAHRHYHTAQHIAECLAQFDATRGLCENPGEVELAIWFHDAIYDPRAEDNEEKSAQWARRVMSEAGIGAGAGQRVSELIMATRHATLPDTADGQIMVDIDLSILGADSARFDEYEDQVRAEYDWVPLPVFRTKRGKILQSFLAREAIYATCEFRNRLEEKARENLARSVAKLAGE